MLERTEQRKEIQPTWKLALAGGIALAAVATLAFGLHTAFAPDIHQQILPPNLTPQDIWPHPHMPM